MNTEIIILAAAIVVGAVSVVFERGLYRRLYKSTDLEQVLLTIGLAFMAIATATYLYGPIPKSVPLPAWLQGDVNLGFRNFPSYRAFLIVLGVVLIAVLWYAFERTNIGAKIRAAVTTAQAGCARLVAVFQPHGFGPARFLRAELATLLPELLRPADRFCYAPIFYAGGTVARDVSSRMLADDLPPHLACAAPDDHAGVRRWVLETARPGDTVLVMGARDPELPRLARSIFEALAAAPAA